MILLAAGMPGRAADILVDDFSSGSFTLANRIYETLIDDGWIKNPGYGSVVESEWTIADGVAKNASTVLGTNYPSNTAAEVPMTQFFSGIASSARYVRFRFDYSVASGDTLCVHLWGYTGTVVSASGNVSNPEAALNGGSNNSEGSSGSGLDAFNLKDGATTGFGAASTAIAGPLTGSGSFETVINIKLLGIAGVEDAGDLSYYLISIAKDEDGTAGTTWVDNLSFTTDPSLLLYDDFSEGSVTTTFRIYENNIDTGWRKMTGYGSVTQSWWTIGNGVVSNTSAVAATGHPANTAAEAAVFQFFSNGAASDTHIDFSFDYSVGSGDTLYAHLWGCTGISDLDGQFISNIEASHGGAVWNEEGNSDELDVFNLKDGATSFNGGSDTAIAGPLTGSGTFSARIDVQGLGMSGIDETGDLTYFMVAFGKDEDGNPGATSVDNVSLSTSPAQGMVIIAR
jgi:hypothetical protein